MPRLLFTIAARDALRLYLRPSPLVKRLMPPALPLGASHSFSEPQ